MYGSRRAVVYADYAQFYLQDVETFAAWMKAVGAVDPDVPPGGWTDEAVQVSRIGIEPHSISVGTARRDFVETSLQLLPEAPMEMAEDAEHVVEADLDVISGAVSLYGCTEQPGAEHETQVPAGRYRVRISYLPSERPARSQDAEPGAYFHYRLDMWPTAEAAAVAVLKQGPFPWAM